MQSFTTHQISHPNRLSFAFFVYTRMSDCTYLARTRSNFACRGRASLKPLRMENFVREFPVNMCECVHCLTFVMLKSSNRWPIICFAFLFYLYNLNWFNAIASFLLLLFFFYLLLARVIIVEVIDALSMKMCLFF